MIIAKARATNVAALCLSAIMFFRIAQQKHMYSCCCMAYTTATSTRSRSTWSRPVHVSAAAVARRRSSFCLYPNKSQAYVGIPSSRSSSSRSDARQHTGTTHLRAASGSQEILTSLKGATVKRYKSLVRKKRKRTEENATIVEGQRAVLDLLSESTTRNLVKHIILEEDGMPEQMMKTFLDLVATCSLPPKVTYASSAVVKACSDTVTPQGVIALASLPAPYQYEACDSNVGTRTYLVLETSDPGNTGTLIRSAIACGVEAILLMPGSCDVWSPKTVRSAMTASFKVPLLQVDSWDECKEKLQQYGVRLEHDFYAASMEGSELETSVPIEGGGRDEGGTTSLPYYEVDWARSQAVVLCVGKEGPGLSQPIRTAVRDGDIRAVHVPMEANIESLNAAVSGSVILFEAARQRRAKY